MDRSRLAHKKTPLIQEIDTWVRLGVTCPP